jgi:Xaa-Pro dipeptidase
MNLKRRNFIRLSTLAAGTGLKMGLLSIPGADDFPGASGRDPDFKSDPPAPIRAEERKERITRAQQLMQQNRVGAIILESGTALEYFTGISWWPSERTMVAIIPSAGEVYYICPAFEENRFRELMTVGKNVYVWQEDESPYELIAHSFLNAGIQTGKIGIEERVRFFIYDGIRKAAPQFEYTSADPVTIPCRLIKSASEIALIQHASNITVSAMKAGINQLREGISPDKISDIINRAHEQQGGIPDFALILFGTASSLPHGSVKPQRLKKGDIVLMDCGCRYNGYSSDITRTMVFGAPPTQHQKDIWNLELKAQAAGFAAAKIGSPCEQVDMAARKVITDAGLGPGYKLPGLPHRTGHGIGMDGHEWGNMVKGNQLLLQAGMCFSIEPTISLPGEFGVRMEDCVYMTDTGPKWFSQPAFSISQPFT